MEDIAARDSHEGERRKLRAEIAEAEAEMDAHVRSFTLAAKLGDPSEAEILAFRRHSQEIAARLGRAKEQLAALPESRVNTITAQQVYALLTEREIPRLLRDALDRDDTVAVRRLLEASVQSARIVERWPGRRRATWARAEVEWTADVQLLLDNGWLILEAPAERPDGSDARKKAAERARRYRQRKREREQRATETS